MTPRAILAGILPVREYFGSPDHRYHRFPAPQAPPAPAEAPEPAPKSSHVRPFSPGPSRASGAPDPARWSFSGPQPSEFRREQPLPLSAPDATTGRRTGHGRRHRESAPPPRAFGSGSRGDPPDGPNRRRRRRDRASNRDTGGTAATVPGTRPHRSSE